MPVYNVPLKIHGNRIFMTRIDIKFRNLEDISKVNIPWINMFMGRCQF